MRFTSTLDGSYMESTYDAASGLVVAYASRTMDGWYALTTHQNESSASFVEFPDTISTLDGIIGNRAMQASEVGMQVAFSVETADADTNWDLDPARRSPFFAINYGSYAAGFDTFAPYATIDLQVCSSFFSTYFHL